MGAAPTHLHQLDGVQRKALRMIGPDAVIQSLAARRSVYALTYLYKLACLENHPELRAIVPPRQTPDTEPRTRSQHAPHHQYQLQSVLPVTASNSLRRSFPYGVVEEWNKLPPSTFPGDRLSLKSLQTFKTNTHRHLRNSNWLWATDSL